MDLTRRYPKKFQQQRKRVVQRDGFKCIICWRGPNQKKEEYWQKYQLNVYRVGVDLRADVDVHHVAYWIMDISGSDADGTLPDEVLVTLCDSCHGKAGTCARGSPFHRVIESYVRELLTKKEQERYLARTPVGVV